MFEPSLCLPWSPAVGPAIELLDRPTLLRIIVGPLRPRLTISIPIAIIAVGRESRDMALRVGPCAVHHQRWIITPLVALVAAAAFATPAHADDQAFLNDLRASGVPVMYEPYYVGLGYKICAQIQAGMSTQDAASQLGIEGQIWGPQIVSAAQPDLCPKTLMPES